MNFNFLLKDLAMKGFSVCSLEYLKGKILLRELGFFRVLINVCVVRAHDVFNTEHIVSARVYVFGHVCFNLSKI
jgi:hypothetical protein